MIHLKRKDSFTHMRFPKKDLNISMTTLSEKISNIRILGLGVVGLTACVVLSGFPAAAQEAADPFAGMDEAVPSVQEVAPVQEIAPAPDVTGEDIVMQEDVPAPDQASAEILRPVIETPDVTAPPPLPMGVGQGDDLFYDADNIVPRGEMGTRTGPRKMNPLTQPASRMIIVREHEEAGSREAQLVAAQRAQMLGRYDAAATMYDELYRKNTRDPRVLMGRAVSYQRMGRTEEAIQIYQELLDLKPNNIEAQVNMLGLMSEKYPAVALRRLLDLHQETPQSVALVAQIAVVQAKLGSMDEALRYLGIAASMEPQNANHVFNMAVIADRMDERDTAMKYYEDALEIDTLNGGAESIPRNIIYERLAQLR